MMNEEFIDFEVYDALNAIYEKIQQGWAQKKMALNNKSDAVSARSPDAVSWCLVGAACVTTYDKPEMLEKVFKRLKYMSRYENLSAWNDSRRAKEDVLNLISQSNYNIQYVLK